jgi:hypothetical protein
MKSQSLEHAKGTFLEFPGKEAMTLKKHGKLQDQCISESSNAHLKERGPFKFSWNENL